MADYITGCWGNIQNRYGPFSGSFSGYNFQRLVSQPDPMAAGHAFETRYEHYYF
jgi:hypothetical protein